MFKLKIFLFFPVLLVFLLIFQDNQASGRTRHKESSKISVELGDAEKSQDDVSFSHPYFIDEGRLRAILSSLYFREKGLLKKRTSKRIFTDRQLDKLAPLVVESLAKATPHKEVFVSMAAEKTLVRDQSSTFSLFVLGKELNVAFSEIRSTHEESPSFKDWKTQRAQEPTSTKGSGFWELIPGKGQRLKEGHTNWLIIDIEDKAFEPVVVAEAEKETSTLGDSIIEERLRKLEEIVLSSKEKEEQETTETERPIPATPPGNETSASGKTLGEKLRELKSLLNEELISGRDYEKKKQEILQEAPPKDRTIPDLLKELKGLKDEGLITEDDYENWKRRLLDKL